MFSLDLQTVFLFHEKGVYEPWKEPRGGLIAAATKASRPKLVWSLFDVTNAGLEAPDWLWHGNAFPIQTVSLDRTSYREWAKVIVPPQFCTKSLIYEFPLAKIRPDVCHEPLGIERTRCWVGIYSCVTGRTINDTFVSLGSLSRNRIRVGKSTRPTQ